MPPTTFSLDRYTQDAKTIITAAQQFADEQKHTEVEPLHLLYIVISRDKSIAEVFRKAGADPIDILAEAEIALKKIQKTNKNEAYLSNSFLEMLKRAEKESDKESCAQINIEHLLQALTGEVRGGAGIILQTFRILPGSLRPYFSILKTTPREITNSNDLLQRSSTNLIELIKKGNVDPVLGRDVEVRRVLQILERRAKNHPLLVGDPGVGKRSIVRALSMRMLAKEVPNNILESRLLRLDLGNVIAGAKLKNEIEERLRNILIACCAEDTILFIEDISALLQNSAGGMGELLRTHLERGDFRLIASVTVEGKKQLSDKYTSVFRNMSEVPVDAPDVEKAQAILRGLTGRLENHHHVSIGEGAIVCAVSLAKRYIQTRCLPDSALDLLDEAAARKRVQIESMPAEVDDAIRKVNDLKLQMDSLANDEDKLSKVKHGQLKAEIEKLEPAAIELKEKTTSKRCAIAALESIRKELAAKEKEFESAKKSGSNAKIGELEHITLPDLRKRLSLAENVVGEVESKAVVESDVAVVLAEWTGIPVAKMLEGEAEKLLKMEERLEHRIVGQNEAVKAVSKAVRRGRAGLRDAGRPIGSFLFLGPSGVGKTELAKALAEFLFDDEQAITRLDMSEFMEKHMAQRLIGAPPGYVDSEEGGFLTEAVRRKPYSVLLFDEVEKAHADVFNLLLQVLDDGRLTDGRGQVADFGNTVVIMTSNIGSHHILNADSAAVDTEEGREELKGVLKNELKNFFRPEFLNRIDDVVVFSALTKENLKGIASIQFKKLDKLLVDKELKVSVTDAARDKLVEIGYEPAFGARPLRRAILREIQDPLAVEILKGDSKPGSVIIVDCKDDKFVFNA